MIDQARIKLDTEKATANAALGNKRIESAEDMTQARIDAAREREILKQNYKLQDK